MGAREARTVGGAGGGPARPDAQAASDVGGLKCPARFGYEHRALRVPKGKHRPSPGQVALECPQRVLAGRHEAGLAALALDAHELRVEVDRGDTERDELL